MPDITYDLDLSIPGSQGMNLLSGEMDACSKFQVTPVRIRKLIEASFP
jgi:hypothetical protein